MKSGGTSHINRVLRLATKQQRRAALAAAVLLCVLLVASIVIFIVYQTGALRPTPTSEAQLQYTLSLEAERAAVSAARAAGSDIDTAPAVVDARISLARAYLGLGQVPQASRLALRLFNANMENAQVVLLYANVLERQGQMERALPAYQRVLDLLGEGASETHREAWRGLATALLDQEDKEAAIDAFQRAAEIRPISPALLIEAGELALELERWQQAAESFYWVKQFGFAGEEIEQRLAELERDHAAEAAAAREALGLEDANANN